MDGDLRFLVVLWVLSAALIGYGVSPLTDRQLHRWSVRFNVLLDPAVRAPVASRLRRARAVRCTAICIGVNVGMLPSYMNVIDVERAADFANDVTAVAPFAAAAVGALFAEFVIGAPRRGVRTAVLVRRRSSDYVPPLWLGLVVASVPIAILGGIVAVTEEQRNSIDVWWVGPAAALLGLIAATIGVRVVVNRPTILAGPDVRRVDDALRAHGAHHVVGASFALAGGAACDALIRIAPGWSVVLPALAVYVVYGCWYGLARTVPWNVDAERLRHA